MVDNASPHVRKLPRERAAGRIDARNRAQCVSPATAAGRASGLPQICRLVVGIRNPIKGRIINSSLRGIEAPRVTLVLVHRTSARTSAVRRLSLGPLERGLRYIGKARGASATGGRAMRRGARSLRPSSASMIGKSRPSRRTGGSSRTSRSRWTKGDIASLHGACTSSSFDTASALG
jgi:hypothetical protein